MHCGGEPLVVDPLFDWRDIGMSVLSVFVDFLKQYQRPRESAIGDLFPNLLAVGR
ncbi:hypothetical protein MA5S0422_2430 [Mycobacteroides abscessus 5S-0422]|uniref:Uncharacterized protein n=1 Tax=Mycobacteroides abscessus subsp. bolletii 1513 TaxID=1299321 RepID=X8DT87_9MYCO|nr:hypothetical protein MA5S0304_1496 [Mycobacteroides abscessus 5S-0304]EIU14215.1 hypothetical protein MA5S0421_1748 [Mycobacteroides abscessus 5S-0421]EIU15115.1 hypothetical protein MA5S0422_2430 [Mycobacteroides abscessus 5S-0422]EIU27034.1 hypothetical protein MA5S0708_1972 [Mycobacteroides abscessus 5S-0708]EIU27329.1 hypothetical protein MA5S0817_1528 [Mycobacteroides abscessus 5S-0817]EIU29530.1 hypothetical protein MA5S1212_4926 [Mycobacteroides abscessus 5S-1212]EIU49690.1 hypothet